MTNFKFIQILKTFSKDEHKKFSKFIRSPYFNTNKTIIKLYEYLRKWISSESTANERSIMQHIEPNKPFSKKRIKNLSSEMLQLCQSFLSQISMDEDKFNRSCYLLKELDQRELQNLFLIEYNRTEESLKRNKLEQEFFNKYLQLRKMQFKHFSTYWPFPDSEQIDSTVSLVYNLSLVESLRCYIGLVSFSEIRNLPINRKNVEKLIKIINIDNGSTEILVIIYSQLYNLIINKNLVNFSTAKDSFINFEHKLHPHVKSEIIMILYNSVFQMDSTENRNEILLLKKETLELAFKYNCFKDYTGFLSIDVVISYVFVLFGMKKPLEAESFIMATKGQVARSNENDNWIKYMIGQSKYHQGNYKEAYNSFKLFNSDDTEALFTSKSYGLVCLYELGEWDNLRSAFKRFKIQLLKYKNKLGASTFESFNNFSTYFNMLLNIKSQKQGANTLISKLSQSNPFKHKSWLTLKFEQLKLYSASK